MNVTDLKPASELQVILDNVSHLALKGIQHNMMNIRQHLKDIEVFEEGYVELPEAIVLKESVEDEDEVIARIHTHKFIVETVLNGDGQDFDINELSASHLVALLKQVEKLAADPNYTAFL